MAKTMALAQKIDLLVEKFDGLSTKVDGLATKSDGLSTRVDGLATKFDGLSTKVDGLATKFDGLSTKVDGLADEVGQLKSKVSSGFEESHRLMKLSLEGLAGLEETTLEKFAEAKDETAKRFSLLETFVKSERKRVDTLEARPTRRRRV